MQHELPVVLALTVLGAEAVALLLVHDHAHGLAGCRGGLHHWEDALVAAAVFEAL